MRKTSRPAVVALVGATVLAAGLPAARGDFDGFGYVLRGPEHLEFRDSVQYCLMYDQSSLDLAGPSSRIANIEAYDDSQVVIRGGAPDAPSYSYTVGVVDRATCAITGYSTVTYLDIGRDAQGTIAADPVWGGDGNFYSVAVWGCSSLRYRSGNIAQWIWVRDQGTLVLDEIGPAGQSIGEIRADNESFVTGSTARVQMLLVQDTARVDMTIENPAATAYVYSYSENRLRGNLGRINSECIKLEVEANAEVLALSGGSAVVRGRIGDLYSRGERCELLVEAGQVDRLNLEYGRTTFIGRDFVPGEGLTLQDGRLNGSGLLSGRWLDGTSWQTAIEAYEAEFHLVPEPGTAGLWIAGALALARRRFAAHQS